MFFPGKLLTFSPDFMTQPRSTLRLFLTLPVLSDFHSFTVLSAVEVLVQTGAKPIHLSHGRVVTCAEHALSTQ